MKLSKAQQEVMNKAIEKIDYARNHTIMEWAMKEKGYSEDCIIARKYYLYGYKTKEEALEGMKEEARRYAEKFKEFYENQKNAIVLTHCNTKTLKKLEELGLIEIIFDSTGYTFGLDTVKVLNY